jgi:hypothetical protein
MSDKFNRSFVDEKGNSLNESSYQLTNCVITNNDGEVSDIRNMVGFIKIHESLFAPSLVVEIGIRDEVNFLEDFGIVGNEKIKLSIETKILNIEKNINLTLRTQKYHDYARSADDNQTQAYVLIAVSEHAYIAPLKLITRSVDGSHDKLVSDIFRGDLFTPITVNGKANTRFKGNISIQNPIKACQKILESAADVNQTPYFLYQDLSTNVYLSPLSFINDREKNPVYRTYRNDKQSRSDSGSSGNYIERSSQILKISSNIGLSPSLQAKKGAFASEHRYINLSRKTSYSVKFDMNKQIDVNNTTSKKLPKVSKANVNDIDVDEGLESIKEANVQYHFVNETAYQTSNGESVTIGQMNYEQKHVSDAYIANYDACSHSFEVMGDILLNPGRTIKILFPKSTSPEAAGTDNYDRVLSGDYLIFSTLHTFMDGTHKTEVVAKTDSIQSTETL